MNIHFCIDIDSTISIGFIDVFEDIHLGNIKGGERVGPILNRATQEQLVSFTTYKPDELLVNKVLETAGLTPENLQEVAIISYKSCFPKIFGKTSMLNMHDNFTA